MTSNCFGCQNLKRFESYAKAGLAYGFESHVLACLEAARLRKVVPTPIVCWVVLYMNRNSPERMARLVAGKHCVHYIQYLNEAWVQGIDLFSKNSGVFEKIETPKESYRLRSLWCLECLNSLHSSSTLNSKMQGIQTREHSPACLWKVLGLHTECIVVFVGNTFHVAFAKIGD